MHTQKNPQQQPNKKHKNERTNPKQVAHFLQTQQTFLPTKRNLPIKRFPAITGKL
jgi:hypothetical protein